MSAKKLLASTLAFCFLFGSMELTQAAQMSKKHIKRQDKKPAATQSISDNHGKAVELRKNEKKKEDENHQDNKPRVN